MRKVIGFVMLLTFLLNFISATSFWIGDEDTNNLDTFTAGRFEEVIEVERDGAHIKDTFGFAIDKKDLNQNITISIES